MELDLPIRTRSASGGARDNWSVGGFDFLYAGGPRYNRNAEALRARTICRGGQAVAGELATWRCCSPAGLFSSRLALSSSLVGCAKLASKTSCSGARQASAGTPDSRHASSRWLVCQRPQRARHTLRTRFSQLAPLLGFFRLSSVLVQLDERIEHLVQAELLQRRDVDLSRNQSVVSVNE